MPAQLSAAHRGPPNLTTQQVLIAQPVAPSPAKTAPKKALHQNPLLWIGALTPAVLLLHGYHPFADDAGIYAAGILKLVDPSLYQPDSAFVLANTHLSAFAHLLAAVLRITRIPFAVLLFLTHLASIFAFLFACRSLARRIFSSPIAQWSSVVLAAAAFTLPVAGTALVLMDPYLTSRSFSTPLGLFALVAAMDRRWARAALLLLLTGLMHPLMAVYVAAYLVLFALVDLDLLRSACIVSAFGVIASGVVYLSTCRIPASAAYTDAVHIHLRTFLFPSKWTWYEDIGLIAPLGLYALAASRLGRKSLAGRLCVAGLLLGASATLSAFLFVHASGPYLLARLQPLRAFHILYTLGVILLGGFLGKLLLEDSSERHASRYRLRVQQRQWAAFSLLALIAASMFTAQHYTYPHSSHIELPGRPPINPWQQAFVWIRNNTPPGAVFAANPDLVYRDGEDAQGFRATARRSILADDKDEGVVVIVSPRLAGEWVSQRRAQAGIDGLTDQERVARLQPIGVTWLLLPAGAATSLQCPYRNTEAKVCRLAQ
jgi:hypothetical protein